MHAISPSSRSLVNALVILTVVTVLANAPALAHTGAKPTTSAPSITGMRAFLFQNKTGQLSEDVLDPAGQSPVEHDRGR
jgi:hypothetical protein